MTLLTDVYTPYLPRTAGIKLDLQHRFPSTTSFRARDSPQPATTPTHCAIFTIDSPTVSFNLDEDFATTSTTRFVQSRWTLDDTTQRRAPVRAALAHDQLQKMF